MVDFEIFVEVAQFAFREAGDVLGVFFFGRLFGLFLGSGELHGG